ncbi:hypothetical protein C772_01481 [Bhargavaea cecembensis DSE10]|uniref:Uncharacterized protein n=2 Tax=Bhargavaea cecembensis TaxID=394098 RepID=M7NHC1_9BACL|nr:hypothetical protein C772_01481 [Bhargavaea cecembensis DSE10]
MTGNYGQWSAEQDDVKWHVGPDLSIPYMDGPFEHDQDSMYEEQPALFVQDQFMDNMGPVYAVPSFSWQQGDSYGAGGGQWQPYGQYPQMPMPCCMRCGYSPWMEQGFWY